MKRVTLSALLLLFLAGNFSATFAMEDNVQAEEQDDWELRCQKLYDGLLEHFSEANREKTDAWLGTLKKLKGKRGKQATQQRKKPKEDGAQFAAKAHQLLTTTLDECDFEDVAVTQALAKYAKQFASCAPTKGGRGRKKGYVTPSKVVAALKDLPACVEYVQKTFKDEDEQEALGSEQEGDQQEEEVEHVAGFDFSQQGGQQEIEEQEQEEERIQPGQPVQEALLVDVTAVDHDGNNSDGNNITAPSQDRRTPEVPVTPPSVGQQEGDQQQQELGSDDEVFTTPVQSAQPHTPEVPETPSSTDLQEDRQQLQQREASPVRRDEQQITAVNVLPADRLVVDNQQPGDEEPVQVQYREETVVTTVYAEPVVLVQGDNEQHNDQEEEDDAGEVVIEGIQEPKLDEQLAEVAVLLAALEEKADDHELLQQAQAKLPGLAISVRENINKVLQEDTAKDEQERMTEEERAALEQLRDDLEKFANVERGFKVDPQLVAQGLTLLVQYSTLLKKEADEELTGPEGQSGMLTRFLGNRWVRKIGTYAGGATVASLAILQVGNLAGWWSVEVDLTPLWQAIGVV